MNQRKSQEGESGLFLVETWNFLFFYPFCEACVLLQVLSASKIGGWCVCARA